MKAIPAAGTMLAPNVDVNFLNPADKVTFFSEKELRNLRRYEQREQPEFGTPRKSCMTNLFFGFFFDGTKNNYIDAESAKNHSNVARLYDCYPGLCVENILPTRTDWKHEPEKYQNFFVTIQPERAA